MAYNPTTKKEQNPMNHFSDKLYQFSLRFVQAITLLLTGILLLSALLLTCFSTDMESQKVLTAWDNPFFTYLPTVLMCLAFPAAAARLAKSGSARRILRIGVLCWCVATGVVQILFSKSVPAADAYSVYSIAESLAAGDVSVVHPTASYLSYYPQQVGLVAFEELLIRIWNLTHIDEHAYHFIKIIYILLECVIILFQEKIVHTLWQDERTDCLYLLLAGTNCPLLMYTAFVYGEIPSFAAISIGFYFLTRLLTGQPGLHGKSPCTPAAPLRGKARTCLLTLGSLLFLTLSVMLRKNSLIYIIAAVLVILVWGIRQKKPALFGLAVLCTFCAVAILPCMQKYYEHRSGNTINSGVPAMSYFAMGMQEGPRADGWYNGYNFDTYRDTGMDKEATIALSREYIRGRLSYFRENPGYALRFYLHKYLSQWADGTFACRQATLNTFGGRTAFFDTIYEGAYSKYLIAYCNLYQNMLYLGAFWFCLTPFYQRRRTMPASITPGRTEPAASTDEFSLPVYWGLIVILGGFLFHMIWEGNSRYIFLYGLTMLPYTARGLSIIHCAAKNRFKIK